MAQLSTHRPGSLLEKHFSRREVRHLWASWPEPGKHLVFDGRLLHGAPAHQLEKPAKRAKVPRVRRAEMLFSPAVRVQEPS